MADTEYRDNTETKFIDTSDTDWIEPTTPTPTTEENKGPVFYYLYRRKRV